MTGARQPGCTSDYAGRSKEPVPHFVIRAKASQKADNFKAKLLAQDNSTHHQLAVVDPA